MAFEEGKTLLTCKACGAVHRVRWFRSPMREPMKLRCLGCSGVLYEGTTVHVYDESTLQRAEGTGS